MEWTVQELAQRAGVTPRALRHYHQIGLLKPDRIGTNGYRYYGQTSVARLQRILLLRDAGLSLDEIATVLDSERDQADEIPALERHLIKLRHDRKALDRRIEAVEHTIAMRRAGRKPRVDMMLEGFNDRYEAEVVAEWGQSAFDASNRWWHEKTLAQQQRFQADAEQLLARWGELHAAGYSPSSPEAQEHAAAHVAWFTQIPGTPTHANDSAAATAMVKGMAHLYTTNPDFHPVFGGPEAAEFAAQALLLHVSKP
ncbi:MerR family transcriptional regulator [uncultured Gulosibacter sp.]|uniref:MerR family transcriptional regulator n=1 Tax=uncultured Gulosibacter sp. TaxID=1339167 RepID=UPI00288A7C05|nr:MerR family transcriptional regulator [uncultured Gulosibacter sp.]